MVSGIPRIPAIRDAWLACPLCVPCCWCGAGAVVLHVQGSDWCVALLDPGWLTVCMCLVNGHPRRQPRAALSPVCV